MKKIIMTLVMILVTTSISLAENCIDCHAVPFDKNEEVIKLAKSYSYVREKTNRNDASEITLWLKKCWVKPGEPYCQAFYVNMWKELYEKNNLGKSPWPMYAGVARVAEYATKHPFEFEVLSTKKIMWTSIRPKKGSLVSWKHGSSKFTGFGYKGHAGFLIDTDDEGNVYTIEGNTKSGPGGDQSGTVKGDMKYGHEGVYERVRDIDIDSDFPIMYFIRSKK